MAKELTLAQRNINGMKALISSDAIKNRMADLLGKESGTFLASVLDLYSSDGYLANCDATKVMAEAIKAAALKLPVSKALGFCYIIPYNNVPQFQLGYKGIIQLAQRSGLYRYINADAVYEGEHVEYDRVTGMLTIAGEATSETAIGYFAYFKLLNGFEKSIYWSKQKVESHAKRYSKAWKMASSPWHTEFDAMAIKTVLKNLISKYGVMSIEFSRSIAADYADTVEAEVSENANGAAVTLPDAETVPQTTITQQIASSEPAQPQIQPETADDVSGIDVDAEPAF